MTIIAFYKLVTHIMCALSSLCSPEIESSRSRELGSRSKVFIRRQLGLHNLLNYLSSLSCLHQVMQTRRRFLFLKLRILKGKIKFMLLIYCLLLTELLFIFSLQIAVRSETQTDDASLWSARGPHARSKESLLNLRITQSKKGVITKFNQ